LVHAATGEVLSVYGSAQEPPGNELAVQHAADRLRITQPRGSHIHAIA
jgi:hypothetical protein